MGFVVIRFGRMRFFFFRGVWFVFVVVVVRMVVLFVILVVGLFKEVVFMRGIIFGDSCISVGGSICFMSCRSMVVDVFL